MSNLTALQQAMRIVEQYAPQLFDTYNANGRAFIDEMTKLLDVEREQMLKLISFIRMHNKMGKSADDLLQEFETYKRGEQ